MLLLTLPGAPFVRYTPAPVSSPQYRKFGKLITRTQKSRENNKNPFAEILGSGLS